MTKAGERLMAAAKEMRGMTTTHDDVMRVARAILKARFYDCEPEMYGSVEEFFASMFSEHVDEAVQEARAAIEAMQPAILAAEKRGEERERERCAKDIANLLEMIRVRNAALEDWENGRIGQ